MPSLKNAANLKRFRQLPVYLSAQEWRHWSLYCESHFGTRRRALWRVLAREGAIGPVASSEESKLR